MYVYDSHAVHESYSTVSRLHDQSDLSTAQSADILRGGSQNPNFSHTHSISEVTHVASDGEHQEFLSGLSVVHSRTIIEGFDSIHHVVELEKSKAQKEMSEKDGYILHLQKQIETMEKEKNEERRLEEEIRQKETELEKSRASITQKMKEIDSLKKTHAEDLDAYKARIRELEMASLEQKHIHLQSKSEEIEEINSLKKAHADELNKYEATIQRVENEKAAFKPHWKRKTSKQRS